MYDNICKFLAENYKDDFARWVFGESKGLTLLSPTELSVEPIRKKCFDSPPIIRSSFTFRISDPAR